MFTGKTSSRHCKDVLNICKSDIVYLSRRCLAKISWGCLGEIFSDSLKISYCQLGIQEKGCLQSSIVFLWFKKDGT